MMILNGRRTKPRANTLCTIIGNGKKKAASIEKSIGGKL